MIEPFTIIIAIQPWGDHILQCGDFKELILIVSDFFYSFIN